MQAFSKRRFAANGYSTHMNFVYDKKAARSGRLKEWDFYQILCGNVVLQLTVGHISWAGQISANLFDLQTGKRCTFSKTMFRTRKLRKQMSDNPEKPSVFQWFGKRVKMQIEVSSRYRRITISEWAKNAVRTEIDVTLTNARFDKEKMVIAIPFDEPKNWYLNYKENCFVADGYARIDDFEVSIDKGNGLLDWGRGVWPKKHTWVWGNGSTEIDGVPFGFNIGWGFGASDATENAFFYDNKLYKLGVVTEEHDSHGFRYSDSDKRFVFEVSPIYNNATHTHMLFVNNSCHQVFGMWQGYVRFPDGKKLAVPPFIAFCEHAENKW